MRIGVLSDTHVRLLEELPEKVIDLISRVDLMVHAGDFTSIGLLNGLRKLGPVTAVQGNMDSAEIKETLPVKELVEVENKRMGITHGSGSPRGISERVREMFSKDKVDIIIYGHSHQAQNEVIDGILFFNPGKATDSFGVLTIEEDIKGEVISSKL